MHKHRIAQLQSRLTEANLEALLVSTGLNIYYLTGFRGANPLERESLVVINPEEAYLFVPQMYAEEAKNVSATEVVVLPPGKRFFEVIESYVGKETVLGFEGEDLKFVEYDRLQSQFTQNKSTMGLVAQLREVKDEIEMDNIRKAAMIADKAWKTLIPYIKVGITERELARKLELIMEEMGSEKTAFDTIVASGVNTALPHHRTSNQVILNNKPVLFDFGAVVNGYCSDITRTIFVGKPSDEFRNIYNLVLKAHDEAIKNVKVGVTGRDIHQVVLDLFGEKSIYLPHSTGHGVGLEIHEGPRLSLGVEDRLEENMVVTIEPGLYFEGKFGVRIEDLGVVKQHAYKLFYNSPTSLVVLNN